MRGQEQEMSRAKDAFVRKIFHEIKTPCHIMSNSIHVRCIFICVQIWSTSNRLYIYIYTHIYILYIYIYIYIYILYTYKLFILIKTQAPPYLRIGRCLSFENYSVIYAPVLYIQTHGYFSMFTSALFHDLKDAMHNCMHAYLWTVYIHAYIQTYM